jgi:PAS domain S-box-containing protein
MRKSLSLSQKALVLIAVPLVFELLFVLTLSVLRHQAEEEKSKEVHAREVASHVGMLLRDLMEETGCAVIAWTARQLGGSTSEPLMRAQILIKRGYDELEAVKRLIKDDPIQLAKVKEIEEGRTELHESWKSMRQAIFESDKDTAIKSFIRTQALSNKALRACDDLINEQALVERSKQQSEAQYRDQIELLLKLGVLANVLLAIFLALYFNRAMTKRLNILVDNSVRLAADRPLNPPLSGDDELADLDKAFTRMASVLAAAARKERAIVDKAIDVICSINQNNAFTRVSPAAKSVWGYDDDELPGKHFIDIVMEPDRAKVLEAMKDLKAGSVDAPFECRIVRKDGKLVDSLWSARWSEEDKTMFCVVHDNTERKEIERMRQEFISMVSHDLRSPLSSVQTFIELLETGVCGELNEKGKRKLSSAIRSVDQLISLIKDLLDLERSRSNKMVISPEKISIATVLEAAIETVKLQADNMEIEIKASVQDNLHVHADGNRLQQVMVNLLTNALKFSPRKSVVVVACKLDGNWVDVRVADQGRGIPPEEQSRVFERFHQVEKTDEGYKGGTGLGLAICKAIVEAHDGQIGVESTIDSGGNGTGSTFWFRIPADSAGVRGAMHGIAPTEA